MFFFAFLIQVPYSSSLVVFLIWVPYSGSLFRFLIWVPYLDSLFEFLIQAPLLGSLFGFFVQAPYLGSLFRVIWVPNLGSLFDFSFWDLYSGSLFGFLGAPCEKCTWVLLIQWFVLVFLEAERVFSLVYSLLIAIAISLHQIRSKGVLSVDFNLCSFVSPKEPY